MVQLLNKCNSLPISLEINSDRKMGKVSADLKVQVALVTSAVLKMDNLVAQDLMADNLADQVTSAASADLKTLVVLVVLMMGINQVKAVQNSVVSAAHKISVVSVVLKDQVGLTMAASVAHKTLVASAQDLMADNLVDQVVLTMDTDQVKADQNLVDQVTSVQDQVILEVQADLAQVQKVDNLVDQVVLTMDTDQVKADQNLVDQVVISVDQETLVASAQDLTMDTDQVKADQNLVDQVALTMAASAQDLMADKATLTVINQVVLTMDTDQVKADQNLVDQVVMMAVNKVVMMAT